MQAERIEKVLTTSGNKVEKFWPSLFANAIKGLDLVELLGALGSGNVSAAAASGAAVTGSDAKEEAKKVEEEEDDDAMEGGMNLFGGDDDDW